MMYYERGVEICVGLDHVGCPQGNLAGLSQGAYWRGV